MTIDREYVEEALLRWNFFPNQKSKGDELPPIFTSRNLVPAVAKKLLALPLRKVKGWDGYDQVEYLSTRYNNVSRPLSIPHPAGYVHLVGCICQNWDKLDYICDNVNSRVKPATHADGRLIIMDYGDDYSTAQRALKFGFGKKYRVHVDIANCYPSIYSHAIPWALVGIKHSKANKGPTHWFNNLDFYQRLIKRNETQGIAIGPATSNIFCESILTRIDEELSKTFSYFRYIDDYTCYCDTAEQAQEFIRCLRDELKQYKLTINIKKTEVVELPAPIDPDWIVDLATRIPSGTPNSPPKFGKYYTASEATRYIDYAVKLNQQTPDGSVLKYAVKSIMYRVDDEGKEQVLEYLLNLCRYFPLLMPCLEFLLEADSIDPEAYENHLNIIVRENAVERRSDGMSWGLYYLNKHDLSIEAETASEVLASRDCISILCLYLSGKYTKETKDFVDTLDNTDLYELDQYWLLLYQLFFYKEIPNLYSGDPTFDLLRDEDICFVERPNHYTPLEVEADHGFVDETKKAESYKPPQGELLFAPANEDVISDENEASDGIYAIVSSTHKSNKGINVFVSKDQKYKLHGAKYDWLQLPQIGDWLELTLENNKVVSAVSAPAQESKQVGTTNGKIDIHEEGYGFVGDTYVAKHLVEPGWDGKEVSLTQILDSHSDPEKGGPSWKAIKVTLDDQVIDGKE